MPLQGANPTPSFGGFGFSISLWAKPDSVSDGPRLRRLIWKNSGTSGIHAGYFVDISSQRFQVVFGDGTRVAGARQSKPVVSGNWYHIVGVRDTSTGRVGIYINGVKEHEVVDTTTNVTFNTNLLIGGRPGTRDLLFHGLIDEVKIYNRALTGDEIEDIYYTIYSNDFEGAVGPEWSNTSVNTTPAGARRFLGQFGNETVSLDLTNLPPHTQATVSFDLFIIRSWDGGAGPDVFETGPDVWDLSVSGGPTLSHTTFANHPWQRQAYPGTHPGGNNPARTGATENNTLGYRFDNEPMEAVYRLSFNFDHSGSALVLNFSGSGLQDLGDESWGLDNVVVLVSEPILGR